MIALYCAVVALLFLGAFGIAACLGGYEAQRDNAEDVRLGLRAPDGGWAA